MQCNSCTSRFPAAAGTQQAGAAGGGAVTPCPSPLASSNGDKTAGVGSPGAEAAGVSALHLRAAPRPSLPRPAPFGECPGASPKWAGNGGLSCFGATRDSGTPGDRLGAAAVTTPSRERTMLSRRRVFAVERLGSRGESRCLPPWGRLRFSGPARAAPTGRAPSLPCFEGVQSSQ